MIFIANFFSVALFELIERNVEFKLIKLWELSVHWSSCIGFIIPIASSNLPQTDFQTDLNL